MVEYLIKRCVQWPELKGEWDGPVWGKVEEIPISIFKLASSDHRPRVRAKLLYDDDRIYGMFDVQDNYVRSVRTNFQDMVCLDSCVEFFVLPKEDAGYINFEFNCGGTLLAAYIADWKPDERGNWKTRVDLTSEDAERIEIYHSMPKVVEPEIQEPTNWRIEFSIPFAIFEKYVGPLGDIPGQEWRANLYKCADETSHPHWASWSPCEDARFHYPEYFGLIRFEAP